MDASSAENGVSGEEVARALVSLGIDPTVERVDELRGRVNVGLLPAGDRSVVVLDMVAIANRELEASTSEGRGIQDGRDREGPMDALSENPASRWSSDWGVPEGCTHYIDGLFGSVTFLQYRTTPLICYFAEHLGGRWEPMGTQPSARGVVPRDIAEYYVGLPNQEFLAVMHAVWLSEGDAPTAAKLLGVAEERIWNLNAGQADAAFCSRPDTWRPDDSRAYLRAKGYDVRVPVTASTTEVSPS
jgi:hypothetical protein